MSEQKLASNEYIKIRSNYLRGTIEEGLADFSTGAMSEDDQQLLKFHGTYQQDDRDLRQSRRKHKLDKAYSFMIRIRVPGGVATPLQWLETDRMASQFANGTIKLTTRQAFQFHGIIKSNLKRTIAEINQAAMDTIAACGDAKRMAKDVDVALHDTIAEQGSMTPALAADYVKQLKKEKRYQRDVY